ncbi:hypothetical protein E0W68_10320 [Flavobacterium salilacus subsp. salilacus]|uniref:hypothetical protein n=1 Tax=Flavobacterium TaxID=237 RepID=UPI001074DE39|nr:MULTISPECIES: hypothetical protein [Flavobacterium]KAF2518124.1 hypothetical protein E0W68_10320 [Flavobacterium salilacus subsp. salilacus]MBE1615566.1 hypothetical protein [Flavobacterium sp. SaA2.13]
MKTSILLFLLLLCGLLSCEQRSKSTYPISESNAYSISKKQSLNPIHYFAVIASDLPKRDNIPSDIYISDISTTNEKITNDFEYKYLDIYENSVRKDVNFILKGEKPKFLYRRLFTYNSYKTASLRRQEILNGDYLYLEMQEPPARTTLNH